MNKTEIYDELRDTEKRLEIARGRAQLAALEFQHASLAVEKLDERRAALKKELANKN